MQRKEDVKPTPKDARWNLVGALFALLSFFVPLYILKYGASGGGDPMGYGRVLYVLISLAIISPIGIAFELASLAREEKWNALTITGFIINGFSCFIVAAILTIILWNY